MSPKIPGALPRRVLVTGASGFVGSALVPLLRKLGVEVLIPSRAELGQVGPDTDWSAWLEGVDAVVHLANRAHKMRETSLDPWEEYRRVNVGGTLRLATEAKRLKVRNFVYLSSIKVMGEATLPGIPFTDASPTQPVDPYGVSKLEAEERLRELVRDGQIQVRVLRPPLVFGPGVKANFRSLIRAVDRGLPLPFGGINNRRNLIGLGNLCDAICACLRDQRGGFESYLVCDEPGFSTPDLVREIALALGKPAPLVRVWPGLLRIAGALVGKRSAADRLVSSLEVDASRFSAELDWVPPFSPADEMKRTVAAYLSEGKAP
jgi:UDP-glucose 4-epimerase